MIILFAKYSKGFNQVPSFYDVAARYKEPIITQKINWI